MVSGIGVSVLGSRILLQLHTCFLLQPRPDTQKRQWFNIRQLYSTARLFLTAAAPGFLEEVLVHLGANDHACHNASTELSGSRDRVNIGLRGCAFFVDDNLNELAKPGGVVIARGLRIPKRLEHLPPSPLLGVHEQGGGRIGNRR